VWKRTRRPPCGAFAPRAASRRYQETRWLLLHDVTVSVVHFVPMEVRGIDPLCVLRFVADVGRGAFIAVCRMEMGIYVTMKVLRSVEPRANADEDASIEPFRTVVAGRSTGIRSNVIVTIRTIGGYSHLDADLSVRFGGGGRNSNPKRRC
jgi:hypothetical protein